MKPANARRFAVLDRQQDDPAGRVAILVRGFLAKRSIDRPIGHDDDLSASGLSSLDMVSCSPSRRNSISRYPTAR
jgi:hypothetical protein